jgi:hypothetical protein
MAVDHPPQFQGLQLDGRGNNGGDIASALAGEERAVGMAHGGAAAKLSW